MAVDDEIWRPGYEGPAPVSGETSFERATPPSAAADVARRRPWGRMVGGASVALAALAAAVVVGPLAPDAAPTGTVQVFPPIDVIDDDRLQFVSSDDSNVVVAKPLRLLDDPGTPFVGADARRLPEEPLPQWNVELAPLVADGGANATTWVHAVDRRYVVIGVGDARALSGPAAVHVLDGSTGRKLWVAQVEMRIDRVDVVAAIDDALVLTVGSEVVAFDLTTGSELWARQLAKVDGGMEQITHLDGTEVLALTAPEPGESMRLIEPRSGDVLGDVVGKVLGSDFNGRWYVLRGGKLFEFDLAAPGPEAAFDAESFPELNGTLVAALDDERARAVAVIDETLVATLDEVLAVGPLEEDGERAVGPGGLTPLTIDLGTPEWMVLVRGIVPLGGDGFAVVGGGTVSGAEIREGNVRFAWQRRGEVTDRFTTERGVALLVDSDAGRVRTLADGATGEEILSLAASSDALDVVGNGLIIHRSTDDGPRVVGFDLDGNELWVLDGSTQASVGDGIVVTSTPQADGSFDVAVYGDAR